jgi:hypothetical protein
MIARFRRTLSKARHGISLLLIMNQDQQHVGRQRYMRREAFRSNLFGREILPTDEKLRAAFFHLRKRFQVWIARAKPRCNRDSERSHNRQDDRNAGGVIAKYRRFTYYAGSQSSPLQHFKTQLLQVSQRFPTSGGAEINDGED